MILLIGGQVLTIFLCIKQVRLNWIFFAYDVQNATYSSHGAPCPTRDLIPWLSTRVNIWRLITGAWRNLISTTNKRVKVQIFVWTIREYPKRHSSYLSDSGDTFLPLSWVAAISPTDRFMPVHNRWVIKLSGGVSVFVTFLFMKFLLV